jgi:hypothetical protein
MEKRPAGGDVRVFKNPHIESDHAYWQQVAHDTSSSHDPVFHLFLQDIDEILKPFSNTPEHYAVFYTLRSYAIESFRSKTQQDDILAAVRDTVDRYLQIIESESSI